METWAEIVDTAHLKADYDYAVFLVAGSYESLGRGQLEKRSNPNHVQKDLLVCMPEAASQGRPR